MKLQLLKAVAVGGLMGLAVTACAPSGAPAPGQPSGEALTAKLEPQRGGVLRFASPTNATNLNPFLQTASAQSTLFDQVYEPLIAYQYLPKGTTLPPSD